MFLHLGVSGYVEICRYASHDKQSLKNTASKISILRLSKQGQVIIIFYTYTIFKSLLVLTKPSTRPHAGWTWLVYINWVHCLPKLSDHFWYNCDKISTSAAFTAKAVAWLTAPSKRRWASQTARDTPEEYKREYNETELSVWWKINYFDDFKFLTTRYTAAPLKFLYDKSV